MLAEPELIGEKRGDFWKRCYEAATERADKAEALLRRIAKANVIFPSMCANNMEAYNINAELSSYAASSERKEP